MITYTVEKIDSFIDEITPILDQHRVELQTFEMKLNPAWDLYKELEKQDKTLWIIAREEGNIVGYVFFILQPNPHYTDYLEAQQDVFYVIPEKRTSRVGVRLIKESEKELKKLDVTVIRHHAKLTNKFGDFLKILGYKETEVLLTKRI